MFVEMVELMPQVEEYAGHPMDQLADSIREPAFETLEKSVDAKQFKEA